MQAHSYFQSPSDTLTSETTECPSSGTTLSLVLVAHRTQQYEPHRVQETKKNTQLLVQFRHHHCHQTLHLHCEFLGGTSTTTDFSHCECECVCAFIETDCSAKARDFVSTAIHLILFCSSVQSAHFFFLRYLLALMV